MNLFFLDTNPTIAAMQHVDRHVVKMPIELAQMLSTAHHILDGACAVSGIYKSAYANHPCSVWVRHSRANYRYAFLMLGALLDEYHHRYGRTHGTTKVFTALASPPTGLQAGPFTVPAQAMPEVFQEADPITAYRAYYRHAKAHIHRWTKRSPPVWL
jgi:hypothetical protein